MLCIAERSSHSGGEASVRASGKPLAAKAMASSKIVPRQRYYHQLQQGEEGEELDEKNHQERAASDDSPKPLGAVVINVSGTRYNIGKATVLASCRSLSY